MAAEASPNGRFKRLLFFRWKGGANKVLRVLEDADKWLYVVNLSGTPDFGPYLKDELVSAFDLESEPCAVHDIASEQPC